MKKIVPFKKDIIFKTHLAEITSISLDHTLSVEKNIVKGNFIVSGEYKMLETSVNTDSFSYTLPFFVDLDERYVLEKAHIDIDDFYYEIINDNILSVNIEVLIDQLEEKKIEEIIEEVKQELAIEEIKQEPVREEDYTIEEIKQESVREDDYTMEEQRCIEEETKEEIGEKRSVENITTLFNQVDNTETYKSYTVYIVRENDSIESIIETYSTTKEELEMYNDLKELKIGDKIIIPAQ